MATHDYVIANGTGAAVRSDLNNALAAIVSNNSSSSEPGTTYAYQWWADTNANVLKIRNSSNDGWITLRELDGTMLIEDGSASTPGLAFADDVNTGIFSPAADQIGFATGGAERLEIGSSEVVFNDPSNDVDFRVESNGQTHMLFVDAGNDRVGIGASSPNGTLSVAESGNGAKVTLQNTSSVRLNYIGLGADDDIIDIAADEDNEGSNSAITLRVDGSEAARIDSSGRLLVGTSSARTKFQISTGFGNVTPVHQFEFSSQTYNGLSITHNAGANVYPAVLAFGKSRGTSAGSYTAVSSGDALGSLDFSGADGTNMVRAALIKAEVDGTPGSNDMPGRLSFATTADGASSPTERVRIDKYGQIKLYGSSSSAWLLTPAGTTSSYSQIDGHFSTSNRTLFFNENTSNDAFVVWNRNSGSSGKGFGLDGQNFKVVQGATEQIRVDSSGRLLVGTTIHDNVAAYIQSRRSSGDSHIQVQSDELGNNNTAIFVSKYKKSGGSYEFVELGAYKHSGITNPSGYLRLPNVDLEALFMWNDDTGVFRTSTAASHIGTTSGTVVGTQTSDLRLKNVGANVSYGLAEVKQLQPKQYALKKSPDVNRLGFIAQEVESIIPEAVFDTNQELPGHQEGDRTKLGMEYVQLIPVLVNAIKELSAEVDTLKTKVAALEAAE